MHSAEPWRPYPEVLKETPIGLVEVEVHRPDRCCVVMGAGGKAEREVWLEALQARDIPLYKRKGGGGTVLLGPNVIVATVHAGVENRFGNLAYFRAINGALIDIFRGWKPAPYEQRGISDIAVADRKLVGSSIFRRRQYLLYQASLLVELDLALMNRVLQPPPREPDYRRGRPHEAFVSCFRELGLDASYEAMMADLRRQLPASVARRLAEVDGKAGPAASSR